VSWVPARVRHSRADVQRSWQAEIVQHLRRSKARGLPFDTAWNAAQRDIVIPGRDEDAGTLFNVHGEDSRFDTTAAFFKRACCHAYEDRVGAVGSGDGPALRHFSVEMMDGDVRLEPVAAA
jgi:hypothetical protein